MNEKAIRVLEYNKIIDMLKEEASSEMAKKIISELKPYVDAYIIKETLAETTEAVSVIVYKGALPLGGFYDIDNSLHLAKKDGTLTMRQLLQVLYNLKIARNVVTFLKGELPPIPIIKGIVEVMAIHKRLEDNIDRCILSEDEMADSASAELKNIRRSIMRQNEMLKSKMNQILNSADNKTMLQDSIITMRQGRYVIPVKQEHRNRFPGIVHDQSATGATLFIEPQVIVNLNNELRELELAERVEIERILAELSGNVAEHYQELLNNQKFLIKLDLMFAKGRLSCKMKGEEPTINEEGQLKIIRGRHPLIPRDKVVPVTVELGRAYNTLVVTGPNTGGKTVTLKTVGLLAMMVQTGLHIPCESGSLMPVFQSIFADIGDEQSIEQSLSTFSSHMKNIVNIVNNSHFETLVLLDELGAGTDPTEGAALAIAILESLYKRGTKTMATTHYTELKKYALGTAGVENASMEFNVETLSPTYKLAIGVPGKSNAFEISEKLGIDTKIIERARNLLDKGDIEFENVISSIEEDKRQAEVERDEAIMLNIEMKRQREDLDKRLKKVEEQREKMLEKARAEARELIAGAEEISRQVQRELKELTKIENHGERNRIINENKKKLRDADAGYRDRIVPKENIRPVNPQNMKIGDKVKVLSLDQNGELLALPDDRGDVSVRLGLLKVTVNIADLMDINEGGKKKKPIKNSTYGSMYRQKIQDISISINVRGKNLDEAESEVDKYLDDAYMAGLQEVTIIHGRGEGILREGIHKMLKTHGHVSKFRKGQYNEGGDGVTLVNLKQK